MRHDTAEVQSQGAGNDVNLTPMLDVVFILLIFFIVTASFIRESGIDLNRPDSPAPTVAADESIFIAIDDDDRIWMDRRLIDPRAVRANIERKRAEKPDADVVIQAHKQSSNSTLVKVMDASRLAGAYGISIASEES